MSERGVFAVDRGIWSDADFDDEPFSTREAFMWLVGEAAWRPIKKRIGSVTVELKRGQCAFSTRFAADVWGWTDSRVRRFLAKHASQKEAADKGPKIGVETGAGVTVVTICNYNKFQRVGLPVDADSDAAPTQHRRSIDANKKHSNIETLGSLFVEGASERDVTPADAPAPKSDPFEDSFWPAYPHKVGKDDAKRAFAKVMRDRKTTLPDLLAGIERYRQTKPPDRNWCNPSTWLNQGRWKDQPAEPSPQGWGSRNGPQGAYRGRRVAHFEAAEQQLNEILFPDTIQ